MIFILVILWLLTPVFLFAGLIDPKTFAPVFRGIPSRKKIAITFITAFFILLFLIGVTPSSPKENPQKIAYSEQTKKEMAPVQELTTTQSAAESSLTPTIPNTPLPSQNPIPLDEYLVTRVIDGDTIEIEGGERVRYIGIDTPEITSNDCYGTEATNRNKELVLGKRVKFEKDVSETDRYRRLLRYVYTSTPDPMLSVNRQLVYEGYARASTYPPDVKYQSLFTLAEKNARESNRGLWSSCTSVQKSSPIQTTEQVTSSTVNTTTEPSGCVIKGNISSDDERIYHVPGCQSYLKTVIDTSSGERWFCTEDEAVGAGWRKAKNCP